MSVNCDWPECRMSSRLASGVRDQIAKQRAVRLVALRPLRRANQIERAPQRRGGKQVVIDVGDHCQPVALGQPVERWRHVGEQCQPGERIEISLDQPGRPLDPEMIEGLRERQLADVAIAPIGLPIVSDVALLPVLPEGLDVDIALPRNRSGSIGTPHRSGCGHRPVCRTRRTTAASGPAGPAGSWQPFCCPIQVSRSKNARPRVPSGQVGAESW